MTPLRIEGTFGGGEVVLHEDAEVARDLSDDVEGVGSGGVDAGCSKSLDEQWTLADGHDCDLDPLVGIKADVASVEPSHQRVTQTHVSNSRSPLGLVRPYCAALRDVPGAVAVADPCVGLAVGSFFGM